MNVLVVGGGGREHALVWKIAQSSLVDKIYCAPGNAGMEGLAECVEIKADDLPALLGFAKDKDVRLTVVGPEDPLTAGIVDEFTAEGLAAFGPSRAAARLEGSKVYAKQLMHKHSMPTAPFRIFEDATDASTYIRSANRPLVVKADGLAKGKGVIVCSRRGEALEAVDRIMRKKEFGDAGGRVVVEDRLEGEEASILAFVDGKTIMPIESSQDHKPIGDGDTGPNTGGMGAYSPAPLITEELFRKIESKVLVRIVHAMKRENARYRGVIYAGLMIIRNEPMILEFNCRFGDPETQPVLLRLKSDLVSVLLATVEGRLQDVSLEWHPGSSVCVVMASGGYPGSYEKGKVIRGLDKVSGRENVVAFHAGTARSNGEIVTNGGRVLGVTARGGDLAEAKKAAYEAVEEIEFEGAYFRRDIGDKGLKRTSGP